MDIGLISDTHGYLDPRVPQLFGGVEHILHAGDIGSSTIINTLEKIAPVTAVLGNNDLGLAYPETAVLQLAGRKIFLHHILEPTHLSARLREQLARENPDLVVFGHSHKTFEKKLGTTLYLNPGYSGRARFNLPRSVARLTCTATSVTVVFLPLNPENKFSG